MNHELTPESVGPSSANYALATLSDAPGPTLHTSGIGPVRPDGTVPPIGRVMAARDEALAGHRCASSLVPLTALANPS